jgi:hypothetical protein
MSERRPGTHKPFILYRRDDVTGVSGTGTVAEGVEWSDGSASLRWCVDGKPCSTTYYSSIRDVAEIHGHDGRTTIVWEF